MPDSATLDSPIQFTTAGIESGNGWEVAYEAPISSGSDGMEDAQAEIPATTTPAEAPIDTPSGEALADGEAVGEGATPSTDTSGEEPSASEPPPPATIRLHATGEDLDVAGLSPQAIAQIVRNDTVAREHQSRADKLADQANRAAKESAQAAPAPRKDDPRAANVRALAEHLGESFQMAGIDGGADKAKSMILDLASLIREEIMAQIPADVLDPNTVAGLQTIKQDAAKQAEIKKNADFLYEAGHDLDAERYTEWLDWYKGEAKRRNEGHSEGDIKRAAINMTRQEAVQAAAAAKTSDKTTTNGTGKTAAAASPGVAAPVRPRAPLSSAPAKPSGAPSDRPAPANRAPNGQFKADPFAWASKADAVRFGG